MSPDSNADSHSEMSSQHDTASPTDPVAQHRKRFAAACSTKKPAEMLLEHLLMFQGCTVEQHSEQEQAHRESLQQTGSSHTRLGDLHYKEGTLNVLGYPEMLSESKTARGSLGTFTPEACMRDFEGRTPNGESENDKKHVCVHLSHTPPLSSGICARVTYDVDSHFGWPLTLGAFKNGIHICFTPPKNRQMQTNLHLRRDDMLRGSFDRDADALPVLDKTTHLLLGESRGALQADVSNLMISAETRVATDYASRSTFTFGSPITLRHSPPKRRLNSLSTAYCCQQYEVNVPATRWLSFHRHMQLPRRIPRSLRRNTVRERRNR